MIEAAPEELALKRELFAELAGICGPQTILATNTSSLSVTAIAAAVPEPERVVGMHFFNPPALMQLVEVVAGEESAEQALAATAEVAGGWAAPRCGQPTRSASSPTAAPGPSRWRRCGCSATGIADHEQIDRICRLGGGFRMGPFELIDLVGIDVNFEVAKSFWEQSFHEPRWQPHPIQARMVAAGPPRAQVRARLLRLRARPRTVPTTLTHRRPSREPAPGSISAPRRSRARASGRCASSAAASTRSHRAPTRWGSWRCPTSRRRRWSS